MAASAPGPDCPRDAFRTSVGAGDPDCNAGLYYYTASFTFQDVDGDGRLDPDEPSFIDVSSDQSVSANDVRLFPRSGTLVDATDPLVGSYLLRLLGSVTFVDVNADHSFDVGEPLYLDVSSSGFVDAGDLRFTAFAGYEAGTGVGSADADAGSAFRWNIFANAYPLDRDGDGRFSPGDNYYLDLDGDRVIGIGDVRLGGVATTLEAEASLVSLSLTPHATLALGARLASEPTDQPMRGRTVSFYAGDELLCTAVTGADGVALCRVVVEQALTVLTLGY